MNSFWLVRLDYDKEAYRQVLNQSVGPGVYRLGEPPISCEHCYPYPPTVRLQRQGDSISKNFPLIDVDSELMGITRKLSKDIKKQYKPITTTQKRRNHNENTNKKNTNNNDRWVPGNNKKCKN